MITHANSGFPAANRDRPLPLHGILIAFRVALLAACVFAFFECLEDRHAFEQRTWAGSTDGSATPLIGPLVVWVALPLVVYIVSRSLVSTPNMGYIALGAGLSAGFLPGLLLLAIVSFLSLFVQFSPVHYGIPMAISLLTFMASSVWILVSACRIGRATGDGLAFFVAAGLAFIGTGWLMHAVL
jgi:hypothetical protein